MTFLAWYNPCQDSDIPLLSSASCLGIYICVGG